MGGAVAQQWRKEAMARVRGRTATCACPYEDDGSERVRALGRFRKEVGPGVRKGRRKRRGMRPRFLVFLSFVLFFFQRNSRKEFKKI